MYIYLYIYLYTYIYVYIYTYIYVYIQHPYICMKKDKQPFPVAGCPLTFARNERCTYIYM